MVWCGLDKAFVLGAQQMAKPKARFGREDWIALGLSVLGREGPEALTLERLTAAARKTRGSFYHHFADHGAFVAALGADWLAREIDDKIAEIDRLRLSGKRTEALARHAAGVDHALERNLRRLAAHEPAIAEIVARSDEKRIAYLVRLFRSELKLDGAEALARARIQHCFFVGAQSVFPDASPRAQLALQKTLGAALWR
jgi:AcrR family transcriptional regulator